MSVERVKSIVRKPKEGKIFITSACSNVTPSTYYRWEFMQSSTDYHEKELQLMRGINGGGLVLNDSCYDWNYAYYKTQEVMFKKYGNDYSLYRLSSMNYTIYCLGESLSSCWTPITETELKNGDYTLDWESKDGKTKTYYNTEEYIESSRKAREYLEEYYQVFIKFLDEKIEGEYYLYSKTYGYIKPKGTKGSFYYTTYPSRTMLAKMTYKKAFCIAKAIDRDVEIKAIPTREYKPTQEQIEEGNARIELLGLDKKCKTDLYISDRTATRAINDTEVDVLDAINEFETNYNAYVYHIIYTSSAFGNLFSMLYVSSNKEEWQGDREDLENKQLFAYVWNKTYTECSEIGSIGIENTQGLRRTF